MHTFFYLCLSLAVLSCTTTPTIDQQFYTGTVTIGPDEVKLQIDWYPSASTGDTILYSLGERFTNLTDSVLLADPTDRTYRQVVTDGRLTVNYKTTTDRISFGPDASCTEVSHLLHWLPRPANDRYREDFTYSFRVRHPADRAFFGLDDRKVLSDTVTEISGRAPVSLCTITGARTHRLNHYGSGNDISVTSFLKDSLAAARTIARIDTIRTFYDDTFGPGLIGPVRCLLLPTDSSFTLFSYSYAAEHGTIRVGYSENDTYQQYILAHELAHFIWNKGAGDNHAPDAFLNESFAEYFSWLYARRTFGEDRYQEILSSNRTQTAELPTIASVRKSNGNRLNQQLLYNKGALLIADVHRELGEAAFRDFIFGLIEAEAATIQSFLRYLDEKGYTQPAFRVLRRELSLPEGIPE